MRRSYYTWLRSRAPLFALLSATTLSEMGNVLAAIAVPWFVLQTTGSAAKTGLAAGATIAAFVLAGLLGGPIVDRLGPKRASVVADLASGLTVALVPLLYRTTGLEFWQLLTLVFLGALLDAPGQAARQGLIPRLAREQGTLLERANSAYQGAKRLAQFLGPPLAGVLVAFMGADMVLLLDAATFVVSAALVSAAVPSLASSNERQQVAGAYFAELREGLRFIRRDALIFTVVLTYTVTELLDAPLVSVALPVYADTVYGSAIDLGIMVGSLGGGALAGTAFYGVFGHRLPRRATFVGCVFLLQLPFWCMAATPSLAVVVGSLFVTGVAAGPLNAMLYTVVQERTPEKMMGRTFGAFSASGMAAIPLGMVICGYLLELVGLRYTLLGGAGCYLLITTCLLLTPALRDMGRPKGGKDISCDPPDGTPSA